MFQVAVYVMQLALTGSHWHYRQTSIWDMLTVYIINPGTSRVSERLIQLMGYSDRRVSQGFWFCVYRDISLEVCLAHNFGYTQSPRSIGLHTSTVLRFTFMSTMCLTWRYRRCCRQITTSTGQPFMRSPAKVNFKKALYLRCVSG